MLEGAFSFRGRIGRLNFFLAELLMLPAGVVAGLVVFMLMAAAPRSTASLVFIALVGGLMLLVGLWYSLSLHVRRIRDIGWDPFVVIVGLFAVGVIDAVVAAKVPVLALDLGHGRHGTMVGALVNLALSAALLFWPGRKPGDIAGVFGDPPDSQPGPSRLARLGLGTPARAEPVQAAAPMRTAVRKEFGRRGVR